MSARLPRKVQGDEGKKLAPSPDARRTGLISGNGEACKARRAFGCVRSLLESSRESATCRLWDQNCREFPDGPRTRQTHSSRKAWTRGDNGWIGRD